MKQSVRRIEEKITTGYSLHFGGNLGDAWRIFSKKPGGFILTYILVFGALLGAGLILPEMVVSILVIPVFPAVLTSFILVSDRLAFDEPVTIRSFFEAMYSDWKPYAYGGIYVIAIVASGVIASVFNDLTGAGLAQENMTIFFFAVFFIYLALSTLYTIPILVFFEAGVLQSIVLSWRLTHKEFGAVLGLCVIMFIIIAVGVSLVLAFLVTMPLATIMIYTSFDEIIDLRHDYQADLMDHLVD